MSLFTTSPGALKTYANPGLDISARRPGAAQKVSSTPSTVKLGKRAQSRVSWFLTCTATIALTNEVS
jgi:hypothetical protein